jgi:hypothetical protein
MKFQFAVTFLAALAAASPVNIEERQSRPTLCLTEERS